MAYHDSSFIPPAKKEAKNMPATAELSVTELQMMLQCLTLTLTLTPYYECNVWGYAVLPEVDISCRACTMLIKYVFARIIQAWLALYLESFRALLPASWADLALVSGRVLIF